MAVVRVVCVTHWKRLEEHYLERQGETETKPVKSTFCLIPCTGNEVHMYVREDRVSVEEFALVWAQSI